MKRIGLLIVLIFGLFVFSNQSSPIFSKRFVLNNIFKNMRFWLKNKFYGIKYIQKNGKKVKQIYSPKILKWFFSLTVQNSKMCYRLKYKNILKLTIVILVIIITYQLIGFIVPIVPGTAFTWTDNSSGNNNWRDQANWNDGASGFPDDNGDTATFNSTWTANSTVDGATTVGNIAIAGNWGGTLTLNADLTVDDAGGETGGIDMVSGTVDTNGNILTTDTRIRIRANTTFEGSTGNHIFGSSSFESLPALQIDANGTFNGGSGNHTASSVAIGSSTTTLTSGTLDIRFRRTAGAGFITFQTSATGWAHNNGTIKFTHAGTQRLWDSTNTAQTLYNVEIDNASCILEHRNNNGYFLTVANNLTVANGIFRSFEDTSGTARNLTVTGVVSVTGTLDDDASSGNVTASFGSITINVGGTWETGAGSTTSGAITQGGTMNITTNATLNGSGANTAWSAAPTWATCTLGNFDIQFTLTTPGTGITITLNNATTLDSITIVATDTFVDGGNTFTFSGNWDNSGTATLTGAAVLSGTNQNIDGSTTWEDFTKSVTATDTLTFDNTATQTFNGTVTLDGASGQLLSIVSDLADNAFNFTVTAGATKGTLDFLSVKDSDASGSDASQKPIAPTNSTDVSGNTDWFAGGGPDFSTAIDYKDDINMVDYRSDIDYRS